MNAATAVFKRELKGYFGTPLAYVFLVIFLVATLFWTFAGGLGEAPFFDARNASLRTLFSKLPWMFAFLGPAAAMRMWAEERRAGTVELLLTLPVTIRQAVLGKFLAGWAFLGIALLLTMSMALTTAYLGDPDPGPIFTGYFGAFLLAGAYLAIGGFFSALTKNQLIALLLGGVFCVLFVLAGSPSVVKFFDGMGLDWIGSIFESLSFLTNYESMQLGMLEFRNVFAILAITIGFVWATTVMLNETKAR